MVKSISGYPDRLSLNALAKGLGKARSTVEFWTKDGLPKNDDRTFRLASVIEWLLARERAAGREEGIGEGSDGANDSATLRWREARASRAELELERMRGTFADREEIAMQWQRALGVVAGELKSIPSGLARKLEGQTTVEIHRVLESALRQAVQRMRDVYTASEPRGDAAHVDTA